MRPECGLCDMRMAWRVHAMSDHDEPEIGEGDEFEMRVEEMGKPAVGSAASDSATTGSDTSGPQQADRFRVARLTFAIVTLAAVVVFGLAPSGGLSKILRSMEVAISSYGNIYPTPTLVQATPSEIGAAPLTCAPPTTSPYRNSIGGSPVWVGNFQPSMKGQATTYVGHSAYTRYGWRALVLFSIEPGATGQVVMRGERLSDGSPLWIGVLKSGQTYYDTRATPSVRAVLDPKNPGRPDFEDTGWAEWGGVLYIPAAGCYALEASWPGGSWRVTFAAGL